MRLQLLLNAIVWVAFGGSPSLATPLSVAPSPGDHAITHSGLDGSAYAPVEGGGYTSEMAASIQKRWFANPLLKNLQASGTTEIECGVKRDGSLGHVKIIQSSGNQSLDEVAVSTAKTAAPLKDLPQHFKGARFRLFFFYNLPSTEDRPACSSLHLAPYKKTGAGVLAPHAIYSPDPEYSEPARQARSQGAVIVALTVTPGGTPTDVCLDRILGMGLDEKAIAAVKMWKFKPGMEDGKPVPVRLSVEVEFRLY
jgi:TonB family protein